MRRGWVRMRADWPAGRQQGERQYRSAVAATNGGSARADPTNPASENTCDAVVTKAFGEHFLFDPPDFDGPDRRGGDEGWDYRTPIGLIDTKGSQGPEPYFMPVPDSGFNKGTADYYAHVYAPTGSSNCWLCGWLPREEVPVLGRRVKDYLLPEDPNPEYHRPGWVVSLDDVWRARILVHLLLSPFLRGTAKLPPRSLMDIFVFDGNPT